MLGCYSSLRLFIRSLRIFRVCARAVTRTKPFYVIIRHYSLANKGFCALSAESVRADSHVTVFVACDNGLRQAHDMIHDCCVSQKKYRSILKHILKRCDNRKSCRKPVVSLLLATKIVPCKLALRAGLVTADC